MRLSIRFLTVLVALMTFQISIASAAEWRAQFGLFSRGLQDKIDALTAQEFHPVRLSGYCVDDAPCFATIWRNEPGAEWRSRFNLSPSEFQRTLDSFTAQGFHPTQISGYRDNGEVRYAAIWSKEPAPAWTARYGMTNYEFQHEIDNRTAEGYCPTSISGYTVLGETRYAAIWVKSGAEWKAQFGMSSTEFQTRLDSYRELGLRPTRISGYSIGGEGRYAAIWIKDPNTEWAMRYGMNPGQMQFALEDFKAKGYQMSDISGYVAGGEVLFAAIWTK